MARLLRIRPTEDRTTSVIAIFQNVFDGGSTVADGVSRTLGYRRVDRNDLVEASRPYGMDELRLNETWELRSEWWVDWMQKGRSYRAAIQAGMTDLADRGNIVYHGHLAHEALAGVQHVMRVLLTAPLELRVEQFQATRGVDETTARRYIEQLDRAYSQRLIVLFGTDWKDPSRYDLVCNVGHMSLDSAVRLMVEAHKLGNYDESPASREAMKNIATAVKVECAILRSPRCRDSEFEVQADDGRVKVSALSAGSPPEEEILKAARRVPGVATVETHWGP